MPPDDVDGASRRSFVRRAGVAALGAVAAAPVLGTSQAAASATPAFVNVPNTFTADQAIEARLGIGTAPQHPLHITTSTTDPAGVIQVYGNGLSVGHTVDWQGTTYDLVDMYHKSSGDAIFVAHQGGEPPGFTATAGGDAAFNCLIPSYLDDTATGWNGSVPNTHQGMKGLFVQAQPTNDRVYCVYLQNWSNSPAIYIDNQDPAHPQGTGGGLRIDDNGSSEAAVTLAKWVVPTQTSPLLNLTNNSGEVGPVMVIGSPGFPCLTIDDTGKVQWAGAGNAPDVALSRPNAGVLHITGGLEFSAADVGTSPSLGFGSPQTNVLSINTNGAERMRLGSDGGVAIGGITPFGSRQLQIGASIAGTAYSLCLQNYHQADGDAVQIEMADGNRAFGLIQGIFTNSVNAGAMSLQVRDSYTNSMTERLRLDGTGIGFFSASPVRQPTVGGSRGGNSALASLITALVGLGLVSDASAD